VPAQDPDRPAAALEEVRRILLPVRDILDGRVEDDAPPAWCEQRGWTTFLLALDEHELARCEAEGPATRLPSIAGAPPDLAALAADVVAAVELPGLLLDADALPPPALRAVTARKRLQLPALLAAVGPMAEHAARIVDVGAGSGHFTRLAAETFAREAVGIERDPRRVARAEDRAKERSPGPGTARFVAVDACREALSLSPDDLAVGLHACGELGDRLVLAAAEAGCDVALVSCCLQKIADPARAPLSRAGEGLSFARGMLGLTNLTAEPRGVEASLGAQIAAREARYALRRLLVERGVEVLPGEEMRGINRRRARAGLGEIAGRALALRGLAAASGEEILRHEEEARRRHAAIRRLSLPRSMLGRLVEIAVVLDRAAALEERGARVTVATLFDRAASPRNVALFASRAVERLPRVAP
jgi:SAM-dependent methyltransferase